MLIRQFIYTLVLFTNICHIEAMEHSNALNIQSSDGNSHTAPQVQTATTITPAVSNAIRADTSWNDSSIFFNDTTLSQLDAAILQISKSSVGHMIGNKLQEDEIKIARESKFDLDTIIFHSDKEWVLWMNNSKVNSLNKDSNDLKVRIIDIQPSYATFQWHLGFNLNDLVPDWQNKLKFSSNLYINKNNTIKYDQFTNVIEFSLSVNQIFILKDLEIEEGNNNA